MMKGITLFLSCLSAASALYIVPSNRPPYNITITERNANLAQDQYLDCYDQPNCYGTRVSIQTNPVPDLAQPPYYFDNRIESCNYNGIYNLHDGYNYNQNNLNVSYNARLLSSQAVFK